MFNPLITPLLGLLIILMLASAPSLSESLVNKSSSAGVLIINENESLLATGKLLLGAGALLPPPPQLIRVPNGISASTQIIVLFRVMWDTIKWKLQIDIITV